SGPPRIPAPGSIGIQQSRSGQFPNEPLTEAEKTKEPVTFAWRPAQSNGSASVAQNTPRQQALAGTLPSVHVTSVEANIQARINQRQSPEILTPTRTSETTITMPPIKVLSPATPGPEKTAVVRSSAPRSQESDEILRSIEALQR